MPDQSLPRLVRGRDHGEAVAAWSAEAGTRVGLAGALAAADRTAEPAWAPGDLVARAWALAAPDRRSERWWPQGVTVAPGGEPTLVGTAYARPVDGERHGARLTVLDGAPAASGGPLPYRHVLLVRIVADAKGRLLPEPVRIHAGGVAWAGRLLHVAATGGGLCTFAVDDVVDTGATGVLGHRFVLPLRTTHRPDGGEPPLRFSFCSVGTAPDRGPVLVVGEYGGRRDPRRVAAFPLEATGHPAADGRLVLAEGPARMQGATWHGGRLTLSCSNGTRGRGDLYDGEAARLRRWAGALPVGPEDLALASPAGAGGWWTVTEHPGLRHLVQVRDPRS